ncbi:TrmB family transcriptional regulator [Streptomyces longispororuber]|uniref:TrmB family transcriptional regulator n=1 Tax=Streptomyces longispororuber TaxID=68230 RepID=UPI00210996E9|nr:helix-turn-helix domain-containing protein [Streptomyces longispororuber]MCQ4208733.1 helix-turn-helix domain-containing protein [Streptomyces longispororuber]
MHRMQALGLTPAEEETYRHVLRHPGRSARTIAAASWHPYGTGAATVRRLKDLGAVVERDGLLWPEEPERVVGRLTEQLLAELHTIMQSLSQTYGVVRSLEDESTGAGRPGEDDGAPEPARRPVERISDPAVLQPRVEELAGSARDEVLACVPCAGTDSWVSRLAMPLCLRMLNRGVRMRLLVGQALPAAPAVAAHLGRLAVAGAQVRVVPSDCVTAVCDGHTALVPVALPDFAEGMFVTTEPSTVSTVVRHFERLWADAQVWLGS